MPDKTCEYYLLKKIGPQEKIVDGCTSPIRYGKLEVEDIEGLEKLYECTCENHKKCFWNSPKSRLESFVKEK